MASHSVVSIGQPSADSRPLLQLGQGLGSKFLYYGLILTS